MTDARYDVIVLGAGVAAFSALNTLANGSQRIACLETFDRIGGNHRSQNINGYTFDIGSFIFHEGYPIFRYFPKLAELCVPFSPSNQRLSPNSQVQNYPYDQAELFSSNPLKTMSYGLSFIKGRMFSRADNAESYIIKVVGRGLYDDLGLSNYVRRFYGVSPDRIDRRFVEDRMQFILNAARPTAFLRSQIKSRFGKQSTSGLAKRVAYARPKEGFETFYAPVKSVLEKRGVEFHFGVQIKGILRESEGFLVETCNGKMHTRRLVNTM
ncbi:MAG: NAD(P)-binding protein, partial [Pseudomonadota bacterium]